jgi:hypothetical protein
VDCVGINFPRKIPTNNSHFASDRVHKQNGRLILWPLNNSLCGQLHLLVRTRIYSLYQLGLNLKKSARIVPFCLSERKEGDPIILVPLNETPYPNFVMQPYLSHSRGPGRP